MSVDPKPQSLFDAISTVNYDRVKLIIDSGASVNSPNDRGQTPLAVACHRGNLEIVDLLIAAGAQMKVQKEPIIPSDEATYTFDLDEVFAANETRNNLPAPDSKEIFVDGDLTMTSLTLPAQQIEFEPSETYAFDLSQDLDRLTAEIPEEQDCLSIPMGEWEENETYVMDLDSFDLFTPEVDEIAINPPQQGVLASFEPLPQQSEVGVGESLTIGASAAPIELRQQIADIDKLSIIDEDSSSSTGTWTESETYAIDLDDLNLAQVMSGNAVEIKSVDESVALIDRTPIPTADNCEEGETYAIDLNDLNLSQMMIGIDPAVQSIGVVTLAERQHFLSDLDSSLFPIIGGEDDADYDSETAYNPDLAPFSHPQLADLTAIDEPNPTNTALMTAVVDGDLDLVKKSISAGANLDLYDWNLSYAPLGMAIDRGHLQIIECLLTAGANPHCGSTSTTALGLAAERGEVEIIQLLLTQKVDVNAPIAQNGWTALLAAIKAGHRSVVQLLVTGGANVNVWSRGETPILFAAKCEEREIYNYLYPLVNTAIKLCADRDGEHLLQATQKRRIRQQNRPVEKFIEMATEGNLHEVNQAIEIGIEIDELGSKGHTALMVAAYYGHQEIVKRLLTAGAKPNILSDDDVLGTGMTALMLAAGSFFASNRQQLVQLLIAGGADVNQRGIGGKTAIFHAALAGSGYQDCVAILIKAGADLDLHDDRGYTVLTSVSAAENYPMLNILMQAGASTAGLDSIQLIQAAASGNVDRVKSLLVNKINLNLDRGAAIGNAAAAGHTQIVDLLIRAGANVNLRDKLGFTPIASAAYSGYSEIVDLLIKAGADTQAPSGEFQSYSALEYAQMGLAQFDPLRQRKDLQHAQIIQQLVDSE
jgi:ankyrin repeat protein